MLSLQNPFSLPNALRRVLQFTTGSKMTKEAPLLCGRQKGTLTAAASATGVVAKDAE